MPSMLTPSIKQFKLLDFLNDLKQLTKFGLSISVVFSSIAGYLLGATIINYEILILLALGGYLMVGASNAFNQVIEIKQDALMKRTKTRPLPTGRLSKNSALFIASIFTILGLTILYHINPKTAFFGALSIFLYTSVYTPLKTVTPLAVFVGAFPGAIPFMLDGLQPPIILVLKQVCCLPFSFYGNFLTFGLLVGYLTTIINWQDLKCCLWELKIKNWQFK